MPAHLRPPALQAAHARRSCPEIKVRDTPIDRPPRPPSLACSFNTLIRLMSVVSLIIAPLLK